MNQFFAIDGLEVSDNGSVRRTYKDVRTFSGMGLIPHDLKSRIDSEGNVIVRLKDHGDIRVDMLVCSCFWGKPRGSRIYVIHLDRNRENCCKENLRWATAEEYAAHYALDPSINTEEGFRRLANGLFVSRSGEVLDKGKLLKVYDSIFDSDTDRSVAVQPHIMHDVPGRLYPRRLNIEDLVAQAYVAKPDNLRWPELLHRDMNYKNCSSDNLQWVEYDCPDWQRYSAQRIKDIAARNQELWNPHE